MSAGERASPPAALEETGRPVAVIDVGSNSIRLIVYDRLSRAPVQRFNERSLCALGSKFGPDGALSEEACACVIKALRRFSVIARAMDVERVDVLATEAVRRAKNGEGLAAAMREAAGSEIRIVGGEEEARLAAQGVACGFHEPSGVVGDLGGGSLEFSRLVGGRVAEAKVSHPLGTLRLQPVLDEDEGEAKAKVDEAMAGTPEELKNPTMLFAVGGSWRALARVHAALADHPLSVAHGYEVDAESLRAFAKDVRKSSTDKIAGLPGMPKRRQAQARAAALTLERAIKALAPKRVMFSAFGLREGWLFERMPPEMRAQDPLLAGAAAFGRRRSRVAGMAGALAAWTEGLGLLEDPLQRRLRLTACELADIGWREHPDTQALEVFRRLSQLPLVGLDHPGRAFLAGTVYARYGGDFDAPEVKPLLALLDAEGSRRAETLGRAMRLGFRLSGAVPSLLGRTKPRVEGDELVIEVAADEALPDADPVDSRLKALVKVMDLRRGTINALSA